MTEEKKVPGKPKIKILYYQFLKGTKVVNFIYEMRKQIYVAELQRVPFEEGIIPFFKNSEGKTLSQDVNIHDFAAHLSSAYRKQ